MDVLGMNLSNVILMLGLCIPFLFSCGDDDKEEVNVPVESVTLSTSSLMLNVGETFQLTATLFPENATNQIVTWVSSDETVATVSNEGLVTAIAIGNVTVAAGVGDKSAICTVTVRNEVVPDEPIVVEGEKASMNLDAFTSAQEIVTAIAKANEAGVTEYILHGEFSKLGIGSSKNTRNVSGIINPFAGTQVKKINMEGVTGFPEVITDYADYANTQKGIPDFAFYDEFGEVYPHLYEVVLPSSVEVIGNDAFYGCRKLANIEMPGVKVIAKEAFQDCESLVAANFPSVLIVGEDAFFSCYNLLEINMPKALLLLEDAFNDCLVLEKVNLPKVETIDSHAFAYDFCEKAVELVLPSADNLVKNVFYDCEKLRRLSLPKATIIGDFTFHNCNELTTLELTTSEPIKTSSGTFDDFKTSACSLILNSNKKGEVNGNIWKGVSWKNIAFVD